VIASSIDLSGRTALITAAAGLLGVQHAAALAEIGARVVVTDLDFADARVVATDVERQFGPGQALPMCLDVSDPSVVAARDSLQADGGVDILVNNAAIVPKVTPQAGLGEGSRVEHLSLDR
jgi:NAD(P)-dependent dehydrogenase (short-subunit alcohol dehydrogenase family)